MVSIKKGPVMAKELGDSARQTLWRCSAVVVQAGLVQR